MFKITAWQISGKALLLLYLRHIWLGCYRIVISSVYLCTQFFNDFLCFKSLQLLLSCHYTAFINSLIPILEKLYLTSFFCVNSLFSHPVLSLSLSWALPCNSHYSFLQGLCQCLAESFYSAHLPWCVSSCGDLFCFIFPPSDLDHFKVHTRSAVSVREGQGVVLLCGTPTSSGGKLSGFFV